VPPVGVLARRYDVAEAAQFGVLALLVPAALIACGSWPSRLSGWAHGRARHKSAWRSFGFLVVECGAVIVWRTPAAVDALIRHPWLIVGEALCLIGAGVLFGLEVVPSKPFLPRTSYPMRIGFETLAMWTSWILGYLLGLSHEVWFPALRHGHGSPLSLIADQQLAAGVLWFIPAIVYAPLIFASLVFWLKGSEDLDDEMHRLLRDERRRWGSP